MIGRLEWFVGLRYLRTGQGRGLASFMSIASLLGITLGVAAVIVVLSAMNGLESEARRRLLSMSDHISLLAESPDVSTDAALIDSLQAVAGVAEVTPFIRVDAILMSGGRYRSSVVRGINPAAEAGSTLEAVVGFDRLARLVAGSNGILLGSAIAADLGLQPGDRLQLLLPEVEDGLVEPRSISVRLSGVFVAGAEQLDTGLALMNIDDARSFLGQTNAPAGLSVRLNDPMTVAAMERSLRSVAGSGYAWSNWAIENRTVFRAMAIEKVMMTILLLFIVAVAAFNIVTSLTMTVNEKSRDIAILRTLGLGAARVNGIFLVQGMVIGVGGILLGLGLGLALAANLETVLPWLEQTFGFQLMPGDVYYVTQVPSEIRVRDLVIIPGLALVIALIATILPSRRAARIDPAEALRYE